MEAKTKRQTSVLTCLLNITDVEFDFILKRQRSVFKTPLVNITTCNRAGSSRNSGAFSCSQKNTFCDAKRTNNQQMF